jgi:cytochrome c551/c552
LVSRNALIAIIVVVAAIIVFAYVTFQPESSNNPEPTSIPTVTSGTSASAADLATLGATLFTQYRCNVCHTTNGERAAGPTLKGLFGSQVKLINGQTVVADTGYLQQSIIDPDSQIVSGYGPSVMSAALSDFTAQLNAGDTVNALVAYIESLK